MPDLIGHSPDKVCRLDKNLYGIQTRLKDTHIPCLYLQHMVRSTRAILLEPVIFETPTRKMSVESTMETEIMGAVA
jgi:hypothetical protein